MFQTGVLTLCFVVELLIRLYLTPPLLRYMVAKNLLEKEAGVGMEVGKHDPGSLINDVNYCTVYKSFRKVHMTIAMGNIITMACSMFHLYYLATKINIKA